jgi:hypothetical protein
VLDPRALDLEALCLAMESNDPEMSWWIDPATGEIQPHVPDVDGDDTPEEEGWTYIPPTESHDAYRDMADFAATVTDPHAAELLGLALEGRGAFRRFRNVVFDRTELGREWKSFRDALAARRALDWLESEGLVTAADADEVRGQHPDPR